MQLATIVFSVLCSLSSSNLVRAHPAQTHVPLAARSAMSSSVSVSSSSLLSSLTTASSSTLVSSSATTSSSTLATSSTVISSAASAMSSTSTVSAAGQAATAHSWAPTLSPDKGTLSGQSAGLALTAYVQPNCPTGVNANHTIDISYNNMTILDVAYLTLSRNLTSQEQLDFSTLTNDEGAINGVQAACTNFLETDSPIANMSNGYLVAGHCYEVSRGTANVSHSPLKKFRESQLTCAILQSA